MNKFYLSFIKNTILSSKPSISIRLLLMVLFVCLFSNVASAVTITITSNTNWSGINTGSGPGGLPNNSDDIVVRGNATLTVNVNNAICASLQLGGVTGNNSGTLTFSTATVSNPSLTVTGLVRAGGAGNANRDGIITFINGSTLTAGSLILGNSGGTPGQGTVTMTAGSIMNVGLLSVINAGHTWTPSTGTVVLTATNTLPNTIFTSFNNLTINSGTTTAAVGFSVAGVLNLAASTTLNMSTFAMTGAALTTLGTGVLRVQNTSGTPLPTGRVWSGTVQYDGVGQTVMVGTYSNLTLSGSGIKKAAGNIIVNNDFALTAGTFVLNNGTSYALTIGRDYLQTGGLFDFNTGTSGTSTMNLGGNLTNSVASTDSMTTSGSGAPNGRIVFNGSSTQNINYTIPMASIWTTYLINAGSSVKLVSNITLKGDSSDPKYYSDFVVNGIIDFGNFILSESSTNGSHFSLNSGAGLITANVDGITASAALGSIQVLNTRTFSTAASYTYNGSSAQVTGNGLPATVSNLTINNSAGLTLGQSTTITNNFSIATGSNANLGTFTHIAGNLTLAGVAQFPESWGSTSSPADNKNDTYFAANTGIVNNSCLAPSINTQPTALTICENTGGSFSVSATGVSAYQWQYSGDNTNWVNIDSALNPYVSGYTTDTFNLSNTPAAWTGNYVRCIVRSSTGCRTNSNSVLLTVNQTLTAPTIGAITQPTCSTATGSVALSGLPTGSWALTRSPGSVTTTGTGTSTTISGLAAGSTYTYAVDTANNGTGLKGEYFNNMTLSGSPALTRTDTTVNFNWGTGSPDASIGINNFSVRWTGFVQPFFSETYTFSTVSDDGIRLWVNGVQVINNWTNHGATTDTGTISLTAGVKYNIVLEFFENSGDAVSTLSWSSVSQSFQIIPTTQLFPVGSCASPASANVVIDVQPSTPAAPTGMVAQSFCSSSNPTVDSLTATGTTIQWYAAASEGSALATTVALVNGTHYYASQTNASGCESTSRFDVTVTVNTVPSAPATATPHSPSCTGFTAQWAWTANATSYYLDVATDNGFTSIVSGYNNINAGNGTSYTLTGLNPATTYYYRVRASGCSTSASSATMSIATSSVAIPGTATPHSASCTGFTAQWAWTENATSYYLDVATDNGFTSIVSGYNDINVGSGTSYTLTGLNPGTTYYYRVRASGCGTSVNSATMNYSTSLVPTVAPVASAATSAGCSAVTVNWSTVANATGYYLDIATDSGFTSFVSGYNNYNIGYSTTSFYAGGLPAGTLYYRLRGYNSCGVTTGNSNTISFSTTTPSTPTVGTTTQPDCVNGGSVVLSGLPASGTINQTGTVITNYVITGTTMTISGLTAGSYNFAASNGSCSSSATGNVVIIAPTTATWTGSAWVNGPPTPSQALEFSGDYNSSGDLTACSCKVTGSKNVVINSGHSLTITNEVTVIGTGTLTFENNASLIQINNVTNVGNITYKRATTTIREFDFTYWSSPVAGQNLLAVSPTSKLDKFFSFDAAANDWVQETPSTMTMDIGKGYIIRGVPLPTPPAPGFYQAPFYGVPNNGDIPITVTGGETSNLIGNPYPSAIYADQFLFDNQSSIDGTIYFWTHNTPIAIGTPDPGTGAWAYSGNDYASYSLTGGVGTGSGIGSTIPGTPPTENVSNRPTGKIAAGQSFFTTSTAAGGPVKFTNAMRVDGSGNPLDNSNFYRTKNSKSKKVSAIEKNRVWLNLTNKQGAFKQTLVGYITGASNTWDKLYDGESFDGNDFLDFYSINDEKNLTIQGRALPFDENDEIPLGYRIAVEGTFTINIGETDGLLANQAIFLEDKLTNTVFDLKTGNYTFNTAAGTFDDRFVLRYTSKTLGTNDLEISSNKVLVSIKNKQIKIDSFAETIDGVAIYDVAGRQIYQKNKVNSNELSIPNFVSSHQILIVKTTLQNGITVSNKIVY